MRESKVVDIGSSSARGRTIRTPRKFSPDDEAERPQLAKKATKAEGGMVELAAHDSFTSASLGICSMDFESMW
jgi:hypothetical protein